MNSGGFFLIIIAFGFLWFVLIRPQKRRQVEAKRLVSSLTVGAEVVTSGGIYGEITAVEDDDVTVRIAPEVEVRVAKRAIAAVVPKEEEPAPEPEAQAPETDG